MIPAICTLFAREQVEEHPTAVLCSERTVATKRSTKNAR